MPNAGLRVSYIRRMIRTARNPSLPLSTRLRSLNELFDNLITTNHDGLGGRRAYVASIEDLNGVVKVCDECAQFVMDTHEDLLDSSKRFCGSCWSSIHVRCALCMTYMNRELASRDWLSLRGGRGDGFRYVRGRSGEEVFACPEHHIPRRCDNCLTRTYQAAMYINVGLPGQVGTYCEDCFINGRFVTVSGTVTRAEPPVYITAREVTDGMTILEHNADVLDYCQIPPKAEGADELTFGVELEVESRGNRDRDLAKVNDLLHGFAITKHDGSLEYGFEIVTVPADILTMKERLKQFLEHRPKGLRSYDTGRCGMHIHIGRRGLSFSQQQLDRFSNVDERANNKLRLYLKREKTYIGHRSQRLGWAHESYLQMWRMWQFLSNRGNQAFVKCIAQRSLQRDRAARYASANGRLFQPGQMWNRPGHRVYGALNPQNAATVELRLFQGTLHYPSVAKNLEFAHALTLFTRPARASLSHSRDYRSFLDFVRNAKVVKDGTKVLQYPYLYDFLVVKGFIARKTTEVVLGKEK